MSVPELDQLLGQVRQLTQQHLAGGADAFGAFCDLVNLLFRLTVLDGVGARVTAGLRPNERMVIEGGLSPNESTVYLRDGRYLRVFIVLFREPHNGSHRIKVEQAAYQYQLDPDGNRWVFRYDYRREARDPHPPSHLQVRGALTEPVVPYRGLLERTHFPTGRVSVEAVIRLLIEQFGVPPASAPEIWRRVLSESERAFEEIAHRLLSGPAA